MVTYIYNNKRRNAAVGICQTFFRQPLFMKRFTKLYPRQTFLLYGIGYKKHSCGKIITQHKQQYN